MPRGAHHTSRQAWHLRSAAARPATNLLKVSNISCTLSIAWASSSSKWRGNIAILQRLPGGALLRAAQQLDGASVCVRNIWRAKFRTPPALRGSISVFLLSLHHADCSITPSCKCYKYSSGIPPNPLCFEPGSSTGLPQKRAVFHVAAIFYLGNLDKQLQKRLVASEVPCVVHFLPVASQHCAECSIRLCSLRSSSPGRCREGLDGRPSWLCEQITADPQPGQPAVLYVDELQQQGRASSSIFRGICWHCRSMQQSRGTCSGNLRSRL